jgi:two-component system, NarL family, sensor histidine kinase DegS
MQKFNMQSRQFYMTIMTPFLTLSNILGASPHRFAHQLEMAREKERIDLASDIHDGPLQDLYATRFLLNGPNDQLERLLSKVRSELREITMRLESPKLENGLSGAIRELIEWYEEKSASPLFRFISIGNDAKIPSDVALTLFRMARTAIANVYKHSQATIVDVACIVDKDVVTIVIKDDGIGFNTEARSQDTSEHCGLFLMRHYAAEIGAKLEVRSIWKGR